MRIRATVPARLNIIGEHTDYAGGLALPFAVEQKLILDVNLDCDTYIGDQTVIQLWKSAGGGPAELSVKSDIPIGKGMSSSAALCVAIAGCANGEVETMESCFLAQKIENEILGTECGLLDQMAMVFAKKGHASLIDFSTHTYEHVPIKDTWKFKLIDSGIHRNLADTNYRHKNVNQCLHVDEENRRVKIAIEASAEHLGVLLNQSHESLRQLGVSLPNMDTKVAEVQQKPGVFGARMMGGGFGGMILALVKDEDVIPEVPLAQSSGSAIIEKFF